MEIEIGSNVIIDGLIWKVDRFQGEKVARAEHENGKAMWFNKHEAVHMGGGLFGLPGRIEAPAASKESSVTTSVAMANAEIKG